MSMIEVIIKIDGKEYTREEAEALYKELAAFLGKPEKVIERIAEKRVPRKPIFNDWDTPYRIPCGKRYNSHNLTN